MAFTFTPISVPLNSVGATQLKTNAVTSVKILAGAVTEPKFEPAVDLVRNAKRTAKYQYDFAIDGGAVSLIPLRGDALPANSIIVGGTAYVIDALVDGGAGASAGIDAAAPDDIITSAAVVGAPWSAPATEIDITPIGTAITNVVWSAGGTPVLNVSAFPLTGGKFELFLDYIVLS
jgi:hypothetical protein